MLRMDAIRQSLNKIRRPSSVGFQCNVRTLGSAFKGLRGWASTGACTTNELDAVAAVDVMKRLRVIMAVSSHKIGRTIASG